MPSPPGRFCQRANHSAPQLRNNLSRVNPRGHYVSLNGHAAQETKQLGYKNLISVTAVLFRISEQQR